MLQEGTKKIEPIYASPQHGLYKDILLRSDSHQKISLGKYVVVFEQIAKTIGTIVTPLSETYPSFVKGRQKSSITEKELNKYVEKNREIIEWMFQKIKGSDVPPTMVFFQRKTNILPILSGKEEDMKNYQEKMAADFRPICYLEQYLVDNVQRSFVGFLDIDETEGALSSTLGNREEYEVFYQTAEEDRKWIERQIIKEVNEKEAKFLSKAVASDTLFIYCHLQIEGRKYIIGVGWNLPPKVFQNNDDCLLYLKYSMDYIYDLQSRRAIQYYPEAFSFEEE